ncbi:hypothetical protein JTB14_011403 [Gonioctena quinquepunctata]|nr:hypothetical protein JTB14_011403 [Gonioctena quinquepunctata]
MYPCNPDMFTNKDFEPARLHSNSNRENEAPINEIIVHERHEMPEKQTVFVSQLAASEENIGTIELTERPDSTIGKSFQKITNTFKIEYNQ